MAEISEEGRIELPQLNIKNFYITLVGDSPLICNAWSNKAKAMMLAKQMKKAKTGHAAKVPEEDFRGSLYKMPDGTYGFPVIAFKAAAVTACTSIGKAITKVAARQAFHVRGDYQTDYIGKSQYSNDLVRINGSEPRMRDGDPVRVGMGTADIRYRGEFWPWFVQIEVRANANVLSAEQIFNLFNTAGFGVGIGEWRAERDGMSGQFHCANEEEVKLLLDMEKKRLAKLAQAAAA